MLVMTLRFSYNRGRMKKENNLTGPEDFSAFYQKKISVQKGRKQR